MRNCCFIIYSYSAVVALSVLLLCASCSKDSPVIQNHSLQLLADTVLAGKDTTSNKFHSINAGFSLTIDIDNDGVSDVRCTNWYDYLPGPGLRANNLLTTNGGIEVATTQDTVYPFIFHYGDNITMFTAWHSTNSHGTSTFVFASCPGTLTLWNGVCGYVGIRKMTLNGVYKYGWLKVNIPDNYFAGYIYSYYY